MNEILPLNKNFLVIDEEGNSWISYFKKTNSISEVDLYKIFRKNFIINKKNKANLEVNINSLFENEEKKKTFQMSSEIYVLNKEYLKLNEIYEITLEEHKIIFAKIDFLIIDDLFFVSEDNYLYPIWVQNQETINTVEMCLGINFDKLPFFPILISLGNLKREDIYILSKDKIDGGKISSFCEYYLSFFDKETKKIFFPLLPNVFADGKVCLGTTGTNFSFSPINSFQQFAKIYTEFLFSKFNRDLMNIGGFDGNEKVKLMKNFYRWENKNLAFSPFFDKEKYMKYVDNSIESKNYTNLIKEFF